MHDGRWMRWTINRISIADVPSGRSTRILSSNNRIKQLFPAMVQLPTYSQPTPNQLRADRTATLMPTIELVGFWEILKNQPSCKLPASWESAENRRLWGLLDFLCKLKICQGLPPSRLRRSTSPVSQIREGGRQ